MFFSGILADFLGQKKIYLFAVFINSLTMIVLMLTKDALWISLAFILLGAGRAFSSGSLEAVFLNRISSSGNDRDLEKLLSYSQFAIPVGLSLGSLLGGILPNLHILKILFIPLSDYYSMNFFISSMFNLLLAVFFIFFISNSEENRLQNPEMVPEKTKNLNNIKKTEGVVFPVIGIIKGSPVFLIIMLTTFAWGDVNIKP